MKLIGLAGPAGVGKDTIADYLVATYGYTKFSFSDALYDEVAEAFGIDKVKLYERSTKEQPMEALQYWYCRDHTFRTILFQMLHAAGVQYALDEWCSPRQVLQWWGTEYRRTQDPEYWIKRSEKVIEDYLHAARRDPEAPQVGLVNCSVRFPNERGLIEGHGGEVWHVRRAGWGADVAASERAYVSEQGLPILPRDKVVHNNGTIEQLTTASSLLLSAAPGAVIRCEPEQPNFTVTCVACGWVHMAYTRAQAVQEVAHFNEWYTLQSPDVQESYGNKPADVEAYESCDRCGGKEFKRSVWGDCPDGSTLGPVIYEE
jgi:hypothetical protein